MRPLILRIAIAGILIIFSIISGIWLSKIGRPLNGLIFSVHKIISLLAIVATGIVIYYSQQGIEINRTDLFLIFATGLVLLLSLISGFLLSFDKFVNDFLLYMHKFMPALIILFSILSIYFIKKKI